MSDATPGGNMVVYMSGIRDFQGTSGHGLPPLNPGLEHEDGRLTVEVIDPFNNHIRFMELTGE
ncbi:glyoxalase superfamily protein [Mesorhizobium sp. dw_380]|uniref:glyoxalase superfamily protein n=1 Tax=Mesorhizobium sp. dw_380 TaxID=2812001 RepID=UPI00254699CC|nr:glyoxalase superfamily protein [Mesorhizobium sp. dw_380]